MKRHWYAPLAVIVSAGIIISATPTPSLADTPQHLQSQLNDARSQLDSLYGQAERASEALNETKVQLDDTNSKISETQEQIEQKRQQLADAQADLKSRVSDDYTAGSKSILDILFSSSSIEDLTSSIYYANKMNDAETRSIQTVRDLQQQLADEKSQLEQQKSEQEQLLRSQEAQQAELASKAASAQSYVNSLSGELQQALAEQEAARKAEAEKAAQEAAAAAASNEGSYVSAEETQRPTTGNGSNNQPNNGSDSHSGSTGGTSPNSGTTTPGGSNGGGNSSPSNAAWRNTVVSAAYSMVGGHYDYGSYDPGSRTFDCSGLVSYCYAVAGYSVPHSSAYLRAFCGKPASQAVAGDIVWRAGHVGICIGGGRTIEAMSPSQGITFGSTGDFVLAGSPA
ncbi:coiled-coil domain-containing protein [Olsenella massiliensis]|uniref:coiled-coil domain-containing protein n=1 Tax=Olsenella massiliensis TaxID=1622075 RepID=UPI000B0FDD62|nr:NlpC/P60 family protein [Olsenella massiliensis]